MEEFPADFFSQWVFLPDIGLYARADDMNLPGKQCPTSFGADLSYNLCCFDDLFFFICVQE